MADVRSHGPRLWPVFGGHAARLLDGLPSDSALESITVGESLLSCLPCLALGLAACGSKSTPIAPATVTSVAVTGTAPGVGTSAPFSATATLSDTPHRS